MALRACLVRRGAQMIPDVFARSPCYAARHFARLRAACADGTVDRRRHRHREAYRACAAAASRRKLRLSMRIISWWRADFAPPFEPSRSRS